MVVSIDMLQGDPLYEMVYGNRSVVDVCADDYRTGDPVRREFSFKTEAEGAAFVMGVELALEISTLPNPIINVCNSTQAKDSPNV